MKYLQTLLLSFFLLPLFSLAQNTIQIEDYYQSTTAQLNYQDEKQVIKASDYKSYDFDLTSLKKDLVKAKHRSIDNFGEEVLIEIPNPDGGSEIYRVLANTTMSPGYQTKFEGIRTFDVIQKNKPSIHGKIDFTQHGFHAMIFNPAKGTFFIDPMYVGNDQVHMVYYRSNFITDKAMSCEFEGDPKYSDKPSSTNDKSFGTCELKTYRLAIAATGEYTTYHGGTVADAAAAQVTTMNRVNGVYERDMAITMEFIEDNDDIIYTNSATDPYTNGNPGLMISQNQTNLTTVIGSANYDIGHVFGTNSGGLASLESVCNSSSKARGVTGSSGPVGDAFDIDYVAHEMGHQFGCNHTFNNSCGGNRNNSTAMEPGSGSTIMAYAGICTPNVQNNSDDHFHGISLQEMGAFTVDDIPNCPATEVLVNVAPTIDSTTGDVFIPANTPFALTAYASDLDDDDLLYCWEQMDAEISQQAPVSTSEFGPNFRSNSPELSPTRYFPNLEDLSDGVSPTWEVLASVTRAFSFRVVVRDNAAGGGCNDHADLVVNTVGTAGPFVVNYPSDAGITWAGLSTQTVTWDLANTNLSPINCSNVDIFLSTDGGLTYPTQLADDAENDGAHAIQVPNTASTECRIMVMAKNGSFFDISDNDFEITSTSNTYTINTSETDQNVCQPNDAVYTIDIGSVDGYTDAVSLSVDGLPSGVTAVFSDNNVSPPTTVTLTISGSDLIVSGGYDFQVLGSSTSGSTILDLFFSVFDDVVDAVVLTYPFDEAIDITLAPTFTWEDAGFGATYDVEIATDISFTNIVQSYAGLGSTSVTVTPLESESTYYWRVNANNSCTDSPSSEVFTFTTAIVNCATFMSSDVPVSISSTSTPTVTSTLEISGIGEIIGITVVDLSGEHTWISDLTISLSSPQGTDVLLFSGICTNDDDWDLNFDDNASSSVIDCPPTGGGTYQPQGSLSSFIGEIAAGTWTLTISDSFNQDGGSLETWGINICYGACLAAEAPVVESSGDNVCPGDLVTLSVSSGNLNDASDWYWFSDECDGIQLGTGSSIDVNPQENTTYYVRGGGSCGGECTSIVVTTLDNATSEESATICQGESYTLPDGETASFSGSFTSILEAANGCDSIITTELTVINLNSTIILSNGVLSSNQPSSGATYQWVDCNNNFEPIEGETGQTFTPTQNGSYACVLTSTNPIACQETSICKDVLNLGIEENGTVDFAVYPNPSNGIFTLSFDNVNSYSSVEVLDYRGRVVFRKELNGEVKLDFDLSAESNGIYVLKLIGENDVQIKKLIKQ